MNLLTYLKRLYRHWRAMFWLVLLFIAAQAFFMYKAVETLPFFLFHMYSTRQPVYDTTHQYRIQINGTSRDHHALSGHQQEMLLGSLSYFQDLRARRFFATDSFTVTSRLQGRLPARWYAAAYDRLTNRHVKEEEYLRWWGRYAARVFGERVDSFAVMRYSIAWNPNPHPLSDTHYIVRHVAR